MKIKKIAYLCNKEGAFIIKNKVDKEGVVTQWLGDGSAFYPLLGAPMLDKEGLCTMFDITEKRRENTVVECDEMSERVNIGDMNSGDIRLVPVELSICYHGTTILPLQAAKEIILIQEKYLEPLDDEKELLELYRREANGQTYVVIKAGMMIRGIVAPYTVTGGLAEKLRAVASACKEEWERKEMERHGNNT